MTSDEAVPPGRDEAVPPGQARRERYHHGDLRAALIGTAVELLGERGLEAFSMAEASRRLGVAVSAPYRHFADRDALLAAVAVRAADVAPDKDVVAIEGRAGGGFRNDNVGQLWIVGVKNTFSLAVDTDDTGDEVRLARLDVTVALGADDLAVALKPAEGLLERHLVAGAQTQARDQLVEIGGGVIAPSQQP